MICKGCKAIDGDRHPDNVVDYTNAKCKLGHETTLDAGMMMPVYKCEKPKSWKALDRLIREREVTHE
jgi:hypothetical protein